MEQQLGFVGQGESHGFVCILRKTLYSLRESPIAWFNKFNSVLQVLACSAVKLAIQCFIATPLLTKASILFLTWMIILLQGMSILVIRISSAICFSAFKPRSLANLNISLEFK